jgi:NAD-dependent SIR2 family protein deacetylase
MKRCTKCGEEKPPTDFRRDRSRNDGRYPQCKACERLWRQENAEHMAEYNRRWREANRDKKRAWDRRYGGQKSTDDQPSSARVRLP